MPLAPGTRFGPYAITAALGAGGMGEVYRARDTRLERDVALKVMHEERAGDAQFRARFEREAKSISALNHPHICTLFDVGHQEGALFLVMELIEGESLADRIAKGPLPPAQMLRLGAQIADALDHAHRQGIVHRDLKPGNVMLTKSGAKLLDFGLARAAAEAPAPVSTQAVTSLPTQLKPLTREGTVLGTIEYMAPEQLEGQAADARTDLFALGALLYEMATGRRAFEGKNRTSLIAAIVSTQPAPISTVAPMTPRALDHVVRRCLEKDPEDRWQSARDVAGMLRGIAESGSQADIPGAATPRRKVRERIAWTLAATMAVIAAISFALRPQQGAAGPAEPDVIRSLLPVASGQLQNDTAHTLAVSPDGTMLAWVDSEGGVWRISVRHFDEDDTHPIPGTENAQQLFFSPDSKWLGFFAGGRLKKVSLGGGAPVVVARAVLPRGASWSADDSILFTPFFYGGVQRVSASGGNIETLTTPDRAKGEVAHRWPHVLPGGKAFLYTIGVGSSWDEARIAVHTIDSKESRVLIQGGYDGRYLPTGHLVYARGEALYAVRFNPESLQLSGDPVRVLQGVARGDSGGVEYSTSDDGRLVYRPAQSRAGVRGALALVDRAGRPLPFRDPVPTGRSIKFPALSPRGDSLAGEVEYELWNFDLVRGSSTRLTSGTRSTAGVWSPDGALIAFAQERNSPWNPYLRRADGSAPEELLVKSDTALQPSAWSPDGHRLLMARTDPGTGLDILSCSLADKTLEPFVATDSNEIAARFSPDGTWVAYTSDESGRDEIYVRPARGATGRWQISTQGAETSYWKKPNEIIFQSGRQVMSVRVRTSPAFSVEPPRVLFEGPDNLLEVMPDGERFLVRQATESGSRDDLLHLVTGWFTEVDRQTRR
ncbi:MAG TPA: protein kinase [Candidatus Polarisedimenticolia bacterium]|nr:protein kinase [Candidatus Polarisedimenticolia bacterium]